MFRQKEQQVYAYNKELQRIEDEETERQLVALHARLEAAKAGKLQDEEK